ncbi:MAG: flagellar hook-basal body complex protein FliE [Spirochaetes bacterium GWB1_48_6]|nr:MAG: flagellar hook-basal body complex protein FliE [Spirochaetes bacterium GWB1_48_6]
MELNASQVHGNIVDIKRTDFRHLDMNGKMSPLNAPAEGGFKNMILDALGSVNADQNKATDLNLKMVTDPNSVDVHDVTISLAQANMSLSLTKAVVDRALRAYNELMNMR